MNCRAARNHVITKLHRPFTRCFVQIPKSKRKQLASKGIHHMRARPGRSVGFHSPYASTYAVMLDPQYKGQQDRMVHSINVTFDDADFTIDELPQAPSQPPASPEIDARYPRAPAEEANDECHDEDQSSSQNPLYSQLGTPIPNRDEYYEWDESSSTPWFTHAAESTGSRPRPSYNKMCVVLKEQAMCNIIMATKSQHFDECMKILTVALPRHQTNTRIAHVLALHAQKDID